MRLNNHLYGKSAIVSRLRKVEPFARQKDTMHGARSAHISCSAFQVRAGPGLTLLSAPRLKSLIASSAHSPAPVLQDASHLAGQMQSGVVRRHWDIRCITSVPTQWYTCQGLLPQEGLAAATALPERLRRSSSSRMTASRSDALLCLPGISDGHRQRWMVPRTPSLFLLPAADWSRERKIVGVPEQ